MKIFSLLLIVSLGLLSSCEKQEDVTLIDPALLEGAWRLQSITFDPLDGSEVDERILNTTVLSLGNNNDYYRNYVSGGWSFANNILTLSPLEELGFPEWEYEVLEVTPDLLKVRITLTEGDYCCDFDEFESNEVLEITEVFVPYE